MPYVIFVAIALVTIITQTESLRLPAVLSHPVLSLGGAVIGTALVGYRFFSDQYGGGSRGLGLYLAVAAALLVLAGCILDLPRSRHVLGDELAGETLSMTARCTSIRPCRRCPDDPWTSAGSGWVTGCSSVVAR